MSGIIESIGRPGENFDRSEGRAYRNDEDIVTDYATLVEQYHQFAQAGFETHHRRRIVHRLRCTAEVVEQLLSPENTVPVEVILPLSSIHPESSDALVTLGENIHPSEVPEWADVYRYWQHPNGNGRTPLQRIERLPTRFSLVNTPRLEDVACLARIWQPFGWTPAAIESLIESYQAEGKFFSGVFDREQNCLVSACLAEGMNLAGIQMFEGTEYGTLPESSGHGLCTAAVIGLHAQILQQHLYNGEHTEGPLILSEFSMTSRSDIVGRHAGMTIPYIEGSQGYENTPFQVLHHNVSVRDGHQRNELRWKQWNHQQKANYRQAFATPYPYWRNFIVGMLSAESIAQHYSETQVAQVLQHIEGRR
jgi:hypothetical protein